MLKTRVFLKLIYLFCRGQIENIKKTQDPQTGASLTWILTSNGSQSELHVRGLSVIFFPAFLYRQHRPNSSPNFYCKPRPDARLLPRRV